jgi:hypothetical protein
LNDVENTLRESLHDHVLHPPPLADLASRAIADALRARARRSWMAAATGALAVVSTLLVGGTIALQARGLPGTAQDGSQVAATPDDLTVIIDGVTLRSSEGTTLSLASVDGGVHQGFRTADGWLLWGSGSADGDQSLWLARSDGSLRCLVTHATGPVAVATGGRTFSWSTGSRLLVGRLGQDGTVDIEYETPTPVGVFPRAIVGETVVVAQKDSDTTIKYDTWQPRRGDYRPTWSSTSHVKWVFGQESDDDRLIGLVPASDSSSALCPARLALVDALVVTSTACGVLQLTAHTYQATTGALSPDGRRLAVQTDDDLTVLDLPTAFAHETGATHWNAAQPGVWLDSTTMVASDQAGVLRRFRDKTPDGEPILLPGDSAPASASHVVPVGQLP